jgi:hypothetical protein
VASKVCQKILWYAIRANNHAQVEKTILNLYHEFMIYQDEEDQAFSDQLSNIELLNQNMGQKHN